MVEGTISLILADNLGSNGIGGFMESFSATSPLCFCMGILDELQIIHCYYISNNFIQCFQTYFKKRLVVVRK